MMKHVLVTNDFPPKVGGIQSLLWEWWRRLPPDSFTVLTSPYPGSEEFDRQQPFEIHRTREPVLLPHPWISHRIHDVARSFGADFVVLDPAVPLGLIGPSLRLPYDVIVHGAEVTVPGRIPGSRHALGWVLRHARQVIAAGGYPAHEADRAAGRPLPTHVVSPGVDIERFHPLSEAERAEARRHFGFTDDDQVIVGISRLVPRKGFDVAIEAVARVQQRFPRVKLVIGGSGRDRKRLEELAGRHRSPVTFLGRVPDEDLGRLYGCADVSIMLCRNRWAGLEQEGFGIVFLEAAACGVPQIAGASGGAAEAVLDGVTGLVASDPRRVDDAVALIESLIADESRRRTMGAAARRRVEQDFSYDVLSKRLHKILDEPL